MAVVYGTYDVCVDWNNDGDYIDAGEDITARVLSMEWSRGRDYASQLTGRSAAGSLSLVLNNDSGDYNSFNSSSPLYGNILPNRKVRVRGGNGAANTVLWVGFLRRIIPYMDTTHAQLARLEAVGPLGYVNQREAYIQMQTSIATGTAIGDILDDAGWPAGDRTIDAGQTTMTRFWMDKTQSLTALRRVEETERGFLVEGKNGYINFEDRHHRLASPHTVSQATFSDAGGATLTYTDLQQDDPLPNIYNEFQATVYKYTVGNLNTLWTYSETGAASPLIYPGNSATFWAKYPTPDASNNAVGVDAWTTPVSSTDYVANSQSDGLGTDLTTDIGVAVNKYGESMEITLTNNNATTAAWITLLQARGTPVTMDDTFGILGGDSTSQSKYGKRTYSNPAIFVPTSIEALSWGQYNLAIYKDPIPILTLTFSANKDADHFTQAINRDISDRISIVAANNTQMGITADFYIENERHIVTQGKMRHMVTWQLSYAEQFSDFWVLDTSKLDTQTRLGY